MWSSDDEAVAVGFGDLESDDEPGAEPDQPEPTCPADLPAWLQQFCADAPPAEVAAAWLDTLTEEQHAAARAEPDRARGQLRGLILGCGAAAVRADKAAGWARTAAVQRELDGLLGLQRAKRGQQAVARVEVLPPGGKGGLGICWSNFEMATAGLRGVTHRLNCAAELVAKPEWAAEEIPTSHVPMEDFFSIDDPEANERARERWSEQLPELLAELRRIRDSQPEPLVNINCKMGKNRSGAAVLIWLCAELGWAVDVALQHLRSINFLSLANPVLLGAVAQFLGWQGELGLLCPDGNSDEGSGWISISPPASPR